MLLFVDIIIFLWFLFIVCSPRTTIHFIGVMLLFYAKTLIFSLYIMFSEHMIIILDIFLTTPFLQHDQLRIRLRRITCFRRDILIPYVKLFLNLRIMHINLCQHSSIMYPYLKILHYLNRGIPLSLIDQCMSCIYTILKKLVHSFISPQITSLYSHDYLS